MAHVKTVRRRSTLTDMDRPGIGWCARWTRWTRCFTGGHGVVRFTDLFVPEQDVLGEVGKGFRYAQVRLAPARLTLHALAGAGPPRPRHRHGARAPAPLPSANRWGARGRGLHARRQRHRSADSPSAHLPRPGCWTRAARLESSRAKVICSGSRMARRRPLRPDPGRPGRDRRDHRHADLHRHAGLPHLRRPERDTGGAWRGRSWLLGRRGAEFSLACPFACL